MLKFQGNSNQIVKVADISKWMVYQMNEGLNSICYHFKSKHSVEKVYSYFALQRYVIGDN